MSKKSHRTNALTLSLAIVTLLIDGRAKAISLDDIQLWAGKGTNRAALVIEWSTPESLANSSVPVPLTDKTFAWGYRFNGTATGTQMLHAILAADPKLYVVVTNRASGTFVEGIGYNLQGDGIIGITDGTNIDYFTNGILTNVTVNVDAAHAINGGDLYWGGLNGAQWEMWNELGDTGGFLASPNRGPSQYWAAYDTNAPSAGVHGQWQFTTNGLDVLQLTDGSWIGFSLAAGEFETNATAAYNLHKHAPPSPDGTYAAYVCDTNDFAVQIVSTTGMDSRPQYNNPNAALGRPTLKFVDGLGDGTVHRTKIIEPPYWTDPNGSNVIFVVSNDGQVTVNLGRRIYDDPDNPYGIDLIIFGNSFLVGTGFVGDGSDLDSYDLSSGIYGHPTTVSVSQDGINWYAYNTVSKLFPQNAYRWDETNHSWTDEQLNPTKPLNPSVYAMNFDGQPVANELNQFIGAAGGSGYDLKTSGLPWIQYVRVEPQAGTYTVIDAIAAVNPVVVGDSLSITPDNLASGITNLVFQKPDDLSQSLISLNFYSVSDVARITTVSLSEFSFYAPLVGNISSAYQITLKPVSGTNVINYVANIGLRAGGNYSGTGNDLRVYQWGGTRWNSLPFSFNPVNHEAVVAGVTNFSAFAISQLVPPQLSMLTVTNGFAFQFAPVANCANILERSPDLVAWTPIRTNPPASAQPVTLQDPNALTGNAFYRIRLDIP